MPFILDDVLLMAALGAGAGALTSKRDPLKGALMGGALGAVGGAAAPGLLAGGAGAGGAASAAGTQAGMLAAQEAGLGAASMGWGGATTGVQGAMNGLLGSEMGASAGGLLGNAEKIAKPVGMAMEAAQPQDQPPPPPPQMSNVPLDLSGLLQNSAQMQAYDQSENERRRQQMAMYTQGIR